MENTNQRTNLTKEIFDAKSCSEIRDSMAYNIELHFPASEEKKPQNTPHSLDESKIYYFMGEI